MRGPNPKPEPMNPRNIRREVSLITDDERQKIFRQQGVTIWLTGFSGSGKSTIAKALERHLVTGCHYCFILDGDNIRYGLNRDLGFSADDRKENIRRIAEVARLFNVAGMIAITAFISPYRADRDMAREIIGDERFLEVHVSTALDVCESRDPKNLYKKARAGEIQFFTGISDPYEEPHDPALRLDTATLAVEESVNIIYELLKKRGVFGSA